MVTCASGIELLHRVGEQVRRGVADDLQALRVLVRHDAHRGVVVDHVEVSTSVPSTLPASAALASPGPMLAAMSATETGAVETLVGCHRGE